jgi:hypothetical protein
LRETKTPAVDADTELADRSVASLYDGDIATMTALILDHRDIELVKNEKLAAMAL